MKKIMSFLLISLTIYSIIQIGNSFSSSIPDYSDNDETIENENVDIGRNENVEKKLESTDNMLNDENQANNESETKKEIDNNQSTNDTQPEIIIPNNKVVSEKQENAAVTIDKSQNNTVDDNSNKLNETTKINEISSNTVSTKFYDSITNGVIEFRTDSDCLSRGEQIQNKELNDILDWNELHPDNLKQQDINYFRCYPVIKENEEGWFLNLFCKSGECNLKYK